VAPTGDLLYRKATAVASTEMTLQWLDMSGKRQPLWTKPGSYGQLRIAPDGKRVALRTIEGSTDVWVYDPQRDAATRLTFGGGVVGTPVWTSDGRFVVFQAGPAGIEWVRSDGAGQPQTLIPGAAETPWSFTADGKVLAYFQAAGLPQIWTVPIEADGATLKAGKPEQFLKDQFVDLNPAVSPDGHWLAYESNSSGSFEVYVRAFPDNGARWQISNGIGLTSTRVEWSHTGHDLIYQQGDQLMAAAYSVKGDTFIAEKPRVWMSGLNGVSPVNWDLTPDGKRAAIATPIQAAEAPKQEHVVVLLQNFADYLRQKVPLEK